MHYTLSLHHASQSTSNTQKYSVPISVHSRQTRSLAHSNSVCPSLYILYSYIGFSARLRKPGAFLALRQVQAERPSYRAGVEKWWSEVISRTAVGAGADPQAVERHLSAIVPSLMKRFSSREGYSLFDDTLVTRAFSLSPRVAWSFRADEKS
jgi:hypothetical protein